MSGFDKFMVVNDIGTGRKLRRLPVVQRWTYVAGVLAIASQSPIRGALLIHDGEHATAHDIAEQATVKDADARATLASLHRLGMLETDAHGVDWLPDWDQINPAPKPSDSPEARRQRKREQREREQSERHAHVTPRDNGVTSHGSHAPSSREHARSPEGKEVKGEEEPYPDPSQGEGDTTTCLPVHPNGKRGRDKLRFDADVKAYAAARFPDLPEPDRSQMVQAALRGAVFSPTHESVEAYVRHWLQPESNTERGAVA